MKRTAAFLIAGLALALFVGTGFFLRPGGASAQTATPVRDLWVASSAGLLKLAADGTDQLSLTDAADALSVTIDESRGTVWVLSGTTLRGYDFQGVLKATAVLPSPCDGDDDGGDDDCADDEQCAFRSALAVSPNDGTVWAGLKGDLDLVSTNGALVGAISVHGSIRSLAADAPSGLMWVGTQKDVASYSLSTATLAQTLSLPKHAKVRSLAVGSGSLFVAFKDSLARFAPNGDVQWEVSADKGARVALDGQGGVWLLSKKNLQRLDGQGNVLTSTSLPKGSGAALGLSGDPIDATAYAACAKMLFHADATGNISSIRDFRREGNRLRGIADYADTVPPMLAIQAPAAGSCLNTRTPQFHVTYSDSGSGVAPDSLSFMLNGAPLEVTCDRTDTGATCSPVLPLPEGLLTLEATVSDKAGNASTPISVQFTVDVTPPVVQVASPADGLLTNQHTLTITGTVSETVPLTLNGAPVAVQGGGFTVPVTLQEGANLFTLAATDCAGNQGVALIHLTLDTIPPAAPDSSKITASSPSGGNVTVTGAAGAAEPLATLLASNARTGQNLNVPVSGDGGFAFSISAQGGDSLSLAARDGAGNSSPAINVIVPGGGPVLPPDPSSVAPPVDPTVATDIASATSFIYDGPNPIQTGVVPGTIQANRVAVLRGKVLGRNGSPISGVTVTILNHPEFGQTLTRLDGMFDMAINGGGQLTVKYEKDGLLPLQRQVDAPWRDFIWAPDVVMISADPQVTAVDLTNATEVQVARGTVQSDADGIRQATLMFQPGTQATMTMPNGTTQPLATIHVRATEYTVGTNGPQAMPAQLPPQSGYTYCAELSADEAVAAGAVSVTFTQSLPFYVENFIHAPVGTGVPVGYYDRQSGQWKASHNGRVIKVLSITNSMADLDIDGTGVPATPTALATLGITDAERGKIALLYAPGQELWRSPIQHFSPCDCNWPSGPPPDAIANQGRDPYHPNSDDTCQSGGSIIGIQNQSLGEEASITGVPFNIHYQSDHTPGCKDDYTLQIPLSGATLPLSLLGIKLDIQVAGREFEQDFSASPNQTTTFQWDGKDAYGRVVLGRKAALIRVGYSYRPSFYTVGAGAQSSFARFATETVTTGGGGGGSFLGLGDITIWRSSRALLGVLTPINQLVSGWTPSIVHQYDPDSTTLYLGSGERRSAEGSTRVITTVAGGGQNGGPLGDGGPATGASLYRPEGVCATPDGGFYIADTYQQRIRKVDPSGLITTVAGNGQGGHSGDGGPATQAEFYTPVDVALGADGSFYIDEYSNCCIRKVDPSGIITTVAGNGQIGFSGDGGPATQAKLNFPTGIAVGPDGSLYIADAYNSRVRRVDPLGIITTIAGNGTWAFSGDGGPATQAQLNFPTDVAIGLDGNLYISDLNNRRIRKVDVSGKISTVAGNGTVGFSGDGWPAIQAKLNTTWGICVGRDGTLYIADTYNQRIRKVDSSGIITTVAGNGQYGFSGDGWQAQRGGLNYPMNVSIGPTGNIYIADEWNMRIRKLALPLPGFSSTEIPIPSSDGSQIYVFNSAGKHLRTINAATGAPVYTFGYTASGLLSTITDGDNNVTTIERDGSGNATAIVSPDGLRTALSLDANGYLASITNPAGEAQHYAYTADGLMTSYTDPKGQVHQFTYDPSTGRLVKDEDPAGGFKALSMSQSDTGWTTTVTTAENRSTSYLIEKLPTGDEHRTVTESGCSACATDTLVKQDGTTISTSRDGTITTVQEGPDPRLGMAAAIPQSASVMTPSGLTSAMSMTRAVTQSDPNDPMSLMTQTDTVTVNGNVTKSVYDNTARTVTTTTPANRQVTANLDAQGRVTGEAVAGLNAVSFAYDARGRLNGVSQGTRGSSLAYDSQGNLASVTDPIGRTVSFGYDAAGRVTSQTLPDGRSIGFSYDANGNVTSVTPPSRPAHNFAYTPVDLQQSYTPPDAGIGNTTTQYAYNKDRQLVSLTRPDGQGVAFGYDAQGKLASMTTPDGTTNLSYDATKGTLTSIETPQGVISSYTYDGFLPLSETLSGPVNGTVSRTFNTDFKVASVSVNGANPIAYAYDNDGLLTGAGALVLTRDAQNGLLTATTLGNETEGLTYNAYGEQTDFHAAYPAGLDYAVNYGRDGIGRITTRTETVNGTTTTWAYGYDQAGRLSDVLKDGAVYAHYDYDPNGNRLDKTNGAGTILASGTYDAQDRMLTYGNNSYTYTANGELTAKTDTSTGNVTTYNYDVLGNLKHVNLPDGTAIDYVVDGRNRRIGKRVNGALTESYLYDGQLRPVATLDASGNVVSRFVYATHINMPDYMIKGGVTYKIITDHLGSPRFIIDSSTGNIAQRMDYDDFGNVVLDTAPGFQPFGFAGGLYDSQTKLVRFGARDYDAETGRWTSKDSLYLSARSSNLFAYAYDDPISFFDPQGKQPLAGFFLVGLLLWDAFEQLFEPEGEPVQVPRPSCGGGYNCHNTPNPPPPPAGTCMLPKYHPMSPLYDQSPYTWMQSSHGQGGSKQPHEPEEKPEIVPPKLDPVPPWGQPPQPPKPPKL